MNKVALIIRMQVCCEHKSSLLLDKYQGIAGIIIIVLICISQLVYHMDHIFVCLFDMYIFLC